jgi:hypothetical protein
MLAIVAPWETVLAAVGGLVLGYGLGLVAGRKRERRLARNLRKVQSRVRASVIPILEGRAQALGLPRSARSYETEDPLDVAVDLSTSIQRHQEEQGLAFSDTVELSNEGLGTKDS